MKHKYSYSDNLYFNYPENKLTHILQYKCDGKKHYSLLYKIALQKIKDEHYKIQKYYFWCTKRRQHKSFFEFNKNGMIYHVTTASLYLKTDDGVFIPKECGYTNGYPSKPHYSEFGGKVEYHDDTPLDTAIREFNEESYYVYSTKINRNSICNYSKNKCVETMLVDLNVKLFYDNRNGISQYSYVVILDLTKANLTIDINLLKVEYAKRMEERTMDDKLSKSFGYSLSTCDFVFLTNEELYVMFKNSTRDKFGERTYHTIISMLDMVDTYPRMGHDKKFVDFNNMIYTKNDKYNNAIKYFK